jgi:hypothetical protein
LPRKNVPPAGDETSEAVRNTHTSLRARAYARKPKPNGRTRPEDIERWERDYKCVQMRRAAVDWVTIAQELGYASTGHAHDRFLAFMRAYPRDDVEAMRDLELDSIEQKMRQLEAGCAKGEARAIEVWNKLSERRSKLMGLDKPERKEVTVLTEDVVDRAIREELEQLQRTARNAGVDIPETAAVDL